jgi:hypothetical protein
MKKLPPIDLRKIVPFALWVSGLGFVLLLTDEMMHIGAILFPLGLLPLTLWIAKGNDQ